MINYGATYGVGFLLSLYLQYIKGFSAETAGLILVAQPVVQTILSPVAGKISDRVEPQIVATIGMAITTIGLSCFIFLGTDTPLWLIITALMILGLGYAFFSSPNTNAIMSSVDKKYSGLPQAWWLPCGHLARCSPWQSRCSVSRSLSVLSISRRWSILR